MERVQLQVTGETFSVLNHSNTTGLFTTQYLLLSPMVLAPNTAVTNGFQVPWTLGSGSYSGRAIQVVAKIVY